MNVSGTADLPLHNGRTPPWLFERMVELSGAISKAVMDEYGRKEFLHRITDPYWFQALACTIGFDWHSSGTTTTTCGALKMAIEPEESGVAVLGGKGKAGLKTPAEISGLEDVFSLRSSVIDEMVYASKMSSKVDNSCIQDDYRLYHHSFFVTEDGDWGVVQQGMDGERGFARRYHWRNDPAEGFVDEPHAGICCDTRKENVLDMTSQRSEEAQKTSVDLVNDGPKHLRRYLAGSGQTNLLTFQNKDLNMPERHPVLQIDISKRGWDVLKRAYEFQPSNYEEMVGLRGMGPKKLRALALVSDLIYGSEPSWEDPVKYSFAHGGKDGTPYPVDRDVYDSTIEVLRGAVEDADVKETQRRDALRRLHKLTCK